MQDEFVRVLGGDGEIHAQGCACVRCVDMKATAGTPAGTLPEAA